MKPQFEKENHNRQDKAKKPEYTERIREEGDSFNRGGTDTPYLRCADVFKPATWARKNRHLDKSQALDVLTRRLRGTLIYAAGYKFRFKHTITSFAEANGIALADAKQIFDKVRTEAEQRLELTRRSLLKAEFDVAQLVEDKTGKCYSRLRLTFDNFLPPVQPINWQKVFKRVLLNPIDKPSKKNP